MIPSAYCRGSCHSSFAYPISFLTYLHTGMADQISVEGHTAVVGSVSDTARVATAEKIIWVDPWSITHREDAKARVRMLIQSPTEHELPAKETVWTIKEETVSCLPEDDHLSELRAEALSTTPPEQASKVKE